MARQRGFARRRQPAGASVGDGFPDQLGDIDDEIRSGLPGIAGDADLAHADADDVIQPAIGLTVGQMKHRPHDLTATRRVGATIPVPLNHDRRPIVSLDDRSEVWPERAGRALPAWKVRPTKAPSYRTLTASLGDKEQLLPAALEVTAQLSG